MTNYFFALKTPGSLEINRGNKIFANNLEFHGYGFDLRVML
jgi:hypothetical protein